MLRDVIDRIEQGEGLGERGGRRGLDPDDHYGALVRSIVGQQLSTKAARSIWERLIAPFGGSFPPPAELIATDRESLREAGLSWSKVGFLRDLAERIENGELNLKRLARLSDEDVVAELIQIKGIGAWTAEMFLIFHLARPDVVSTGDLGIRRAVQLAYGLDDLPGPGDLERIAEPWRPHRTLACLYLWRSLDNTPA